MTADHNARSILHAMQEGHTQAEYINMIWASRYPTPSPASSTGWPYQVSAGLSQPSKIRKIK